MSRRLLVVPILLLVGVSTGCSTFSDNDAAARVGDEEISQDQLGDLLVAATPTTLPGSGTADDPGASAETARTLLTIWILTRVLEIDLAAQGQTVSAEAIADATGAFAAQDPANWAQVPIDLQTLQVEQQAALATWSELGAPTQSDDELRSAYAAGTDTSGVVCSAHILVASESEAQAVLDQLEGGADFAELAASESTDIATAPNGGVLPCDLTASFDEAYAPEFVAAALAAELGEPVGPVQTEFGYHVIVLRPPDQVDPGELAALYGDLSARFRRLVEGLDIYVDPRFGSFDPGQGVIALG